MNYRDFARELARRGLRGRECSPEHWQILDGDHLVNVWANSKRGFRYQVRDQKSRFGTLGHAIEAAGPPLSTVTESARPPWEEPDRIPEPHLGLIRRFIRWLW